MPASINNREDRWRLRLSRVRDLRDQVPNAPALALYQATLQFQADLSRRFRQTAVSGVPLKDQIDVSALGLELPSLLEVSAQHGPELLRSVARELAKAGEQKWRDILSAFLSSTTRLNPIDDFFARACLQPVAENLQLQMARNEHSIGSVCPLCGGLPQLAVLKPEGEGASRSLICSFCFCEWPFRRVICPWCGEEDKERLPRYSSDHWNYVHVEACETCKHYLKAVDLSINGLAVPLVDEAALAVLDVWATEQGYSKIVRNLVGF